MKLTDNILDRKDEITESLRQCGVYHDCQNCYYHGYGLTSLLGCSNKMEKDAARLIDAQAARIAELEASAAPVTGDTSDGYHTFNELYHHRAVLFSVVCAAFKDRAWKAKAHADGTMYEGMFIVGIDTPDGPATYHYDIDPYWEMFDVKELDAAPVWDGHTPDDAIRRIGGLAKEARGHG